MSKDTAIQYADSSLNLMMGCDGCELWNKSNHSCYAGQQTDKWAGKKGWPLAFDMPRTFPERMAKAESWKDLTGFDRDGTGKPWLNGMPRVVFLNDMGDTFTKSLDVDWLGEFLPRIARSPHIYLLLTKRPSRFADFSSRYPLPANVWPGTTITSNKTIGRLAHLLEIESGGPKWISVEPMWEAIDFGRNLESIGWVVFGFESKQYEAHQPTRGDIDWIGNGIDQCRQAGAAPFVKQLGSAPYFTANRATTDPHGLTEVSMNLKDIHGGDWKEWPANLRIREMPLQTHAPVNPCLL